MQLGLTHFDFAVLAVSLGMFTCRSVMAERGCDCKTWLFRQGLWARMAFYWTQLLLIAFSVSSSAKEFVYAAF